MGLKLDFPGGWAFRSSATISNRYPTSAMSRRVSAPSSGGPGVNYAVIYDPQRAQTYTVVAKEDYNPEVVPEGTVTQSVGVLVRRGDTHRFRASLDSVDTRKRNGILFLEPQTLMNLEGIWPDRVSRLVRQPGDAQSVGYVDSLLTGLVNVASRHSQNWNASVDYTWMECANGRLDAYVRLVYFQKYQRQLFPTSPTIDELGEPEGSTSGLMRYRSNFGVSWTGRRGGFGLDGHYYSRRKLPAVEWPGQGSDHIRHYLQFDAFVETSLSRWLPRRTWDRDLTVQLRVNNVTASSFPGYAHDASGAGVQAYDDWRGRTYSLSVTATY